MDASPTTFHAGEQALQARLGLSERMAEIGPRVIRDHMPDQHRELFGKLPTLQLGALDAAGQPWATQLDGPPGFVTTPDARRLHIAARADAADPVLRALVPGAALGVLGLEPQTRRRNRMNGTLASRDGQGGLLIEVRESFGNCPQYIAARRPEALPAAAQPAAVQALGPGLDAAALELIARSDSLFIATAAGRTPGQGVDVSHRGGEPGFVRAVQAPQGLLLELPDYPGNRFFNTLGNLLLHPRAGLLFVDREGGDLLHLAVEAELLWEDALSAAELEPWPGAERLLRLRPLGGLWRPAASRWRWSAPLAAPQFAALRMPRR
jgi:hypothetical protein